MGLCLCIRVKCFFLNSPRGRDWINIVFKAAPFIVVCENIAKLFIIFVEPFQFKKELNKVFNTIPNKIGTLTCLIGKLFSLLKIKDNIWDNEWTNIIKLCEFLWILSVCGIHHCLSRLWSPKFGKVLNLTVSSKIYKEILL